MLPVDVPKRWIRRGEEISVWYPVDMELGPRQLGEDIHCFASPNRIRLPLLLAAVILALYAHE